MDFFTRYPMMTPHVGPRFRTPGAPSLLLVGESHYLPEDSTQHLSPATWYGGTHETLTAEERLWIDTPTVLANACAENFANKGHWIWKNAFEVINDHGPKHAAAREVANDIAFLNFFLRPARTSKSLAWHLTDEDVAKANEAFAIHVAHLAPSAIVLVSRLAKRCFQPVTRPTMPITATPHPSSHWWNRSSKRYGGKRGRDILAEFVAGLGWPARH